MLAMFMGKIASEKQHPSRYTPLLVLLELYTPGIWERIETAASIVSQTVWLYTPGIWERIETHTLCGVQFGRLYTPPRRGEDQNATLHEERP